VRSGFKARVPRRRLRPPPAAPPTAGSPAHRRPPAALVEAVAGPMCLSRLGGLLTPQPAPLTARCFPPPRLGSHHPGAEPGRREEPSGATWGRARRSGPPRGA
jgi:hypothetical protein